MLAQALERRTLKLEPGEFTDPFRFKDAMVVMTLSSRQPSRYTTLSAAHNEMIQRVRVSKLNKVKVKWLKDLRRRTFHDVRM